MVFLVPCPYFNMVCKAYTETTENYLVVLFQLIGEKEKSWKEKNEVSDQFASRVADIIREQHHEKEAKDVV